MTAADTPPGTTGSCRRWPGCYGPARVQGTWWVRLGRDEFVIARERCGIQDLVGDMERLRRTCGEHPHHSCLLGQAVTLSTRVVGLRVTLNDSVRRADAGMCHAKRECRSQVHVLH